MVISTEAHDDESPSSKADNNSILKTDNQGPFYRAAELFGPLGLRTPEKGIKIAGIVRSIRKQKHAAFAHISDGSTFTAIQAVLNPELAAGYVRLADFVSNNPVLLTI